MARWLGLLSCLVAFVVVCLPICSGAVRFNGRYVGVPFGHYQFKNSKGDVMEVFLGRSQYFLSESQKLALDSARINPDSLRHHSSPSMGYIGREVDIFTGESLAGSGFIAETDGIWVVSCSSTYAEFWDFGNQVSWFGPSLALYLLLAAAFLLTWPLVKKPFQAVMTFLNKPLLLTRVSRV